MLKGNKVLRIILVMLLIFLAAGCTVKKEDSAKKKLIKAERDSVLAESPLPGAGVVGKAIEASDSSAVRAKRLDEEFK